LMRRPLPADPRSLQATDMRLSGYRSDGSLEWAIQAETASMRDNTESLQGVTVTHHPEQLEPLTIVAASLARASGGSTLSGGVRIVQGDQLAVESETLYWDDRNHILEAGAVVLRRENLSIQAGAFHHDLRQGVTLLSRGILAETEYDTVVHRAHADAAEADPDRFILRGNVSVENDEGDIYQADRLELSGDMTEIALFGDVTGHWQSVAFTAETLRMGSSGLTLQGRVTLEIELPSQEAPHDT
jgi:lipopolysaccharide assembly outer membrane protein LptD (OstA)